MKFRGSLAAVLVSPLLLVAGASANAANSVTALDLFVEPPTLNSIGLEWRIDGDDNRNASATVMYHKAGDGAYKQALPMLRLQGERTLENVRFDVISPNMFAGSIVDLEPDTDYEIIAFISDPDGIAGAPGSNKKQMIVHTRPEPQPVNTRVFHVYPFGFTGTTGWPASSSRSTRRPFGRSIATCISAGSPNLARRRISVAIPSAVWAMVNWATILPVASITHTAWISAAQSIPVKNFASRSASDTSDSSRWQRRPGEEDSYRAVTNRRSAARLPVASPCPPQKPGAVVFFWPFLATY